MRATKLKLIFCGTYPWLCAGKRFPQQAFLTQFTAGISVEEQQFVSESHS
jgi:hypothetical protein